MLTPASVTTYGGMAGLGGVPHVQFQSQPMRGCGTSVNGYVTIDMAMFVDVFKRNLSICKRYVCRCVKAMFVNVLKVCLTHFKVVL
jgi:hypothetical protein